MIQALLFILILHVGVNFVGFTLAGSQPAVTSQLWSGITSISATVPVSGSATTNGFPSSGSLYIDGEAMQYSGISTPCIKPFEAIASCFTGVERGKQLTAARSHFAGARIYDEIGGGLNNLSNFESRTSIDELGETSSIWASGAAVFDVLTRSTSWDWPMFEGQFAVFRMFGAGFTVAVIIGLSVGFFRAVRPF